MACHVVMNAKCHHLGPSGRVIEACVKLGLPCLQGVFGRSKPSLYVRRRRNAPSHKIDVIVYSERDLYKGSAPAQIEQIRIVIVPHAAIPCQTHLCRGMERGGTRRTTPRSQRPATCCPFQCSKGFCEDLLLGVPCQAPQRFMVIAVPSYIVSPLRYSPGRFKIAIGSGTTYEEGAFDFVSVQYPQQPPYAYFAAILPVGKILSVHATVGRNI